MELHLKYGSEVDTILSNDEATLDDYGVSEGMYLHVS